MDLSTKLSGAQIVNKGKALLFVVVMLALSFTASAQNAPVITATNQNIPENTTAVETVTATDADAGDTKTFSISGGDDAAKFAINTSTGELTFLTAPDFEIPTDVGTNNVYDLIVTVTDAASNTDSKAIAITVTNVNDNSPVINATNQTIPENTTAVETVTATDVDAGDTKIFSISGGDDAAKFAINTSTGELTFLTAPDFEIPTDVGPNNVYDLIVTVTDAASNTNSKAIAITVTNVNDNSPVINATNQTIPENTTAVETVTATDADAGDTKTFSISGGVDAAKFAINTSTGVLTFVTAPDFEIPTDVGTNNAYDLIVTVTDAASHTDSKAITITVTNVNDNSPVINATNQTIPENTTAVETVTATDADAGDTKTFSISGGVDAAKFAINTSTGVLTFVTAPDFEIPTDVGTNNAYDLIVTVTDAASHTDSKAITITVTNVNDNSPVINATNQTIPENTTAVETVTATDADAGDTKTFSISGGVDAAKFAINTSTGVLTFVTAPDFEIPTDVGTNNAYDLIVTVTDAASHTDSKAITITVTNVNDNSPVINATNQTIPENTTAVETVTATDADAGDTKTFSISGGVDAAKFAINTSTGVLTFVTAPDFEIPTDVGTNNAYDLIVTVTDAASHTDSKAITITVTNVNDNSPVINATNQTIPENTTAVETVTATDADAGDTKTFSISGGVDAAKFAINTSTGVLTFVTAPDFEIPTDVGTNNAYDLIVTVTDAASHTDSKAITITVTNVNDNSPVINATNQTIPENTTAVETVTATDADAGDTKTFSISGGVDAAKFAINTSTGVLTFVTAPDFEIPTDVGTNNAYDLIVTVTDAASHTDSKAITITVTNVNDNSPVINATNQTIPENTTAVETVTATDADAGDTKTFSISGGVDAAKFAINTSTGVLTFVTAPDFEIPTDVGTNNAYDLIVTVTDAASHTDSKAITITVTNVNDNSPVINATNQTIPENTTAVETVTATDADAGDTKTFSISGGVDAAKFAINTSTGVLTFVTAPDFEIPTDVGTNNAYDLIVTVTDAASHTDSKAITITVTNVNDNSPVINATNQTIPENTTAVETVTATDADAGDTKTFSISGGVDAAKFAINTSTGVLTFVTAPDFEIPTDVGTNNAYDLIVTVTDAASHTDSKAITITVTNVNDNSPVINATNQTIPENTTAVETVTATDVDAGDTKIFSISGGDDAAKFAINTSTGELTFLTAPDFEIPTDVGPNNVYDLIVTVTDAASNTNSKAIAITVTNVNDNSPVINATNQTIPENTTAVETVTATDADAGDTKTFSISGGVDAAKFAINTSTGVLTFVTAPDFEIPTDVGTNNAYDLIVTVTDAASHTDSKAITITVTNVNDNSPVINDPTNPTFNSATKSYNITTPEDTPINGAVKATDADGNTLTYSKTTDSTHGTATVNADGTYTYAPVANYNGNDSFTITVNDGNGGTTTATINVTVTPINDIPVAVNDNPTMNRDAILNGNVSSNDTPSGDGGNIWTKTTNPAHGSLTFNTTGTYVYTPVANYSGTDSFTYTITDVDGSTSTATVNISIAQIIGAAPLANNDNINVNEDEIVNGNAATNDTPSADGGNVWAIITNPLHGTATMNPVGTYTYSPNPNFNGNDNFTYSITDINADKSVATINITVIPVNDPPVATPETITTPEDTPINGTVKATDVDGNVLTYSKTTNSTHGNTTVNPDGTYTYTPTANYNGSDSFTVTVNDGNGGTTTATINIIVTPVNDAPVLNDPTNPTFDPATKSYNITTPEDTPINGAVRATDVDGNTLTYSKTTDSTHGTATVNADGTYTYVPVANYNGNDSFTVTVNDGNGGTTTATINIIVTSVNDTPVAVNDNPIMNRDAVLNGDVSTNDIPSGDGGNIWTKATNPSHGTLVFNTNGTYTYTPVANYSGSDSFAYTITDTDGNMSSAIVYISISQIIGAAPLANNDNTTVNEDEIINGNAATNDIPSVDGGNVWAIVTNSLHGTATMNPVGTYTYSPNPNYNGNDSFTYSITDINADKSIATINITVTPVNDPPVATASPATTMENKPVNGTITATDIDGDPLTFANTTDPSHGTATVSADGTYSYTPTTGFNGNDSFTVTVNDGKGGKSTVTVNVTVAPPNNPPVINDPTNPAYNPLTGSYTVVTPANSLISGKVNATDINNDPLSYSKDTDPTNGTATVNTDGTYIYTPNANYTGHDSFRVKVNDGKGGTATVIVNITTVALPKITMKASKPVLSGNDTFIWTYTITVNNGTNQKIDSVRIIDNMDNVFKDKGVTYEITSITASGSLWANGLFNGSGKIETLTSDSSYINSNNKDSILIEVKVNPHSYVGDVHNQAHLNGYIENIKYHFTNILSDDLNFGGSTDSTVTSIPQIDLFVPNAFSPNGDAKNQTFVITHSGSVKLEFEVFNRWGNSVYKNSDYQNDWDGKGTGNFLGQDLPSGTYYCVYKAINTSTGVIENKGVKYITLRR